MTTSFSRLCVTGGCGFIGSHFIASVLERAPHAFVLNVDALTYAAHPATGAWLAGLSPERYAFERLDIASEELGRLLDRHRIEVVVNFAAETHVDRSILDPGAFLRTNVVGAQNLLERCRERSIRLVHVSTDEVYGSLGPNDAPFTERSPLDPSSPYAASKAAADLLLLAAHRTFGQDVVITRCSNNLGPRQFPEKLIPLVIANAIDGEPIPVYGDGKQVRDWVHVADHCDAIEMVMRQGRAGEVYNVGSRSERTNLEIVGLILAKLSRDASLVRHVGDRPGHDRRYGIDPTKIERELGWRPQRTLEASLADTIDWYLANESWWRPLRSGEYRAYYAANYAPKFEAPGASL